MTVVQLPTRNGLAWSTAEAALNTAVEVADHPLLHTHTQTAAAFLRDAGLPTMIWANRIAAIHVIADRRADVAPTMARRSAYLEVAQAAIELLDLAEELHGARPDAEAAAILARTPGARLTKI